MQIHYELISEGSKATCSTCRKGERERERRRHSQTGSFLGNAYGKYQVKFVCNWNLITDNTHHTHTQTHRMIVLLCCSMFVTLLLRVCVCVCGTVLICNWHCILNRLHLAHQRPGHRDSRTHTHTHADTENIRPMPKAAMPHRIEGALRELPHYLIGQCIENWRSIGKCFPMWVCVWGLMLLWLCVTD